MNTSFLLLSLACTALVIVSLKRVPEGHAYTIHRFGHYRRTLGAGLHWVLPLIERVAHRVSLAGRALTLSRQPLGDGRGVLQGKVYYQVLDAARADAEADHLDDVVLDSLQRALRDAAALAERATPGELNSTLKPALNAELRLHGIVVTRCQLDRIAANSSALEARRA